MNANQTTLVNLALRADRKYQIATLKTLRAEGVKLQVKLTASARAIYDEMYRLLKVAATVVKQAVSKAATDVKVSLAYWQARPVKPLNLRAIDGAIALSIKLGF